MHFFISIILDGVYKLLAHSAVEHHGSRLLCVNILLTASFVVAEAKLISPGVAD